MEKSKTSNEKKPYTKPKIESAKIYERLSLACTQAISPCRRPLKS